MKGSLRRFAVLLAAAFVLISSADAEQSIDFNRDIRPILSDKCFFCHGPAEDSREADLRLDLREEALDYGAIVPGKPEESYLIERILSEDEFLQMPPPESKKFLTEEEKQTLRRWVESGAEYAGHWAYEKLPIKVETPAGSSDWPRNEIDRFVLKALEEKVLQPNIETEKRVWLRRVTFDLTGLPPKEKEIEDFLADKQEQAYQRVVDRLLESNAYAERMASEWLDVARYSDSYGYQRDDERYVWPYRDWVIEAFKKNLPYDEFVTWQIAGDLLPNATREQKLATVFCRLHSHKKEGGVAVEEFRVENVADRTHTFASAFLGLTMECARCHDHKYDPITMRDYYSLSSFFANVDERGLISYFTDVTPTPAMPLPSPEQEQKLSEATQRLRVAEQEYAEAVVQAESRFPDWLRRGGARQIVIERPQSQINFDVIEENPPEDLLVEENTGFRGGEKKKLPPENVIAFANAIDGAQPAIMTRRNSVAPARQSSGVKLTGDDSIVIPGVGHIDRHEPITVSLWALPAETPERAVLFRRSRGWDDAGSIGYALVQRGARLRAVFAHFWPGNAVAVETGELIQPDVWRHITLTYDGSSQAAGLRLYLDGEEVETSIVQDSLTRSIQGWRGGYEDLAIGSRYRDRGFKNGTVDDFRCYDRELTAIEVRAEYRDASSDSGVEGSERSEDELWEYYVEVVDEETRSAWDRVQQERLARNQVMDEIPSITIMREQASPRPAYILERGGYDARGERVTADSPQFLQSFPSDAPQNRLGLAQWLFEPDHPLTARVAVNRYWQMIFGAGLVRTPEDFGSQGSPPSHPELLDWLSRDFVNSGWDIKRLLRMMTLSATYRQSSVASPEVRSKDPENRLLSRGPSKRLSAEMIRDNALVVSGLLVNEVGGPPVRPYDLQLAYTPVDANQDEGLYRRSLYTFWKRTSPSPVMMTMNANRREVCLLKREVVSSPLQALVLLNGTQFVETSRALSQHLLVKHGEDRLAFIQEAFQKLTSRSPSEEEADILLSTYDEQLKEFQSDPSLAKELLAVGLTPLNGQHSSVELAAATIVVNSIMNLEEAVRCR